MAASKKSPPQPRPGAKIKHRECHGQKDRGPQTQRIVLPAMFIGELKDEIIIQEAF